MLQSSNCPCYGFPRPVSEMLTWPIVPTGGGISRYRQQVETAPDTGPAAARPTCYPIPCLEPKPLEISTMAKDKKKKDSKKDDKKKDDKKGGKKKGKK
jgi:hypothetical protein